MRKIFLDAITQRKDETGISYERISARIERKRGALMSISKLQRIFTGQQEPTIPDFEMIVEDGLEMDLVGLYAKMGAQEFRDTEPMDYKGAKELMAEFAAERAKLEEAHQLEKKIMRESHEESKRLMREEHAAQIEKLKALRLELQEQFQQNTNLLTERYNANSKFLTEHVAKIERLNDQLTERATRAEEIAQAAQARAEKAEKRIDVLDKRRQHVFWGMLAVVVILLALLAIAVILDLPMIGMGNG